MSEHEPSQVDDMGPEEVHENGGDDAPAEDAEYAVEDHEENGGHVSPSAIVDAAGARLYEQAREAMARREMMSQFVDAECTFSPQINARRRSKGESTGGDMSPHERLYMLAREQERKLKEKAEALDSEYTFRPSLSKRAQQLKKREAASARQAYEVLYEKALEQRAKMEEARLTAGLDGCTFTPELSRKAQKLKRPGSAVARLYDPEWVAMRRSEEHNDPLAAQAAECTFKPEINPATGRKTSPRSDATVPVYDRLYAVAADTEHERQAARDAKLQEEMAACSFRPDITRSRVSARRIGVGTSQRDSTMQAEGAAAKDPYARLYAHALERNQRLSMRASAEELGCTFKPEISRVSRRISEASRRESAAEGLPRHELLYEQGLQKQHARKTSALNQERELTEDDLANLTFRPAIRPLPGKQLIATPVYDRLYDNARAKQATLAAAASGEPLPPHGGSVTGGSVGSAPSPHGHRAPGEGSAASPAVPAVAASGVSPDAAASKEMFLI